MVGMGTGECLLYLKPLSGVFELNLKYPVAFVYLF